eukprot:Blabericola_migrator_1__5011@NODE_25_length_21156_cov_56_925364_g22_i0_p6_GENE_NODE_25_length_21156_cov_56_925364_g22_i0NODE_25_length_21156_cov_56_925364_g22_i0_p6_ORF_typecomplete_len160_score26_24_NODE_25_length_21156_cov_56_925364_g22_i01777318252
MFQVLVLLATCVAGHYDIEVPSALWDLADPKSWFPDIEDSSDSTSSVSSIDDMRLNMYRCICQKTIATHVDINELNICADEMCERCSAKPELFGCSREQVDSFGGLELCIVEMIPFCYVRTPTTLSGIITLTQDIATCVYNSTIGDPTKIFKDSIPVVE